MASNSLSYLDKLRLHYGIDELKSAFRKICNNQNKEAARLINDNKLSFASLFVLLPEIEEFNLYHDLNQRNIAAVKISAKVLKDKNITLHFDNLDINKTDIPYMEWMLKSGAKDDGLSKDFDKVLDAAALLLIITYKNKKIMPLVIDMIFKRNRKGAYIHDLVWALYNSHDLSAFKTIARYLYSENKKDIELGCKLLDLEPSDENNNQLKKQYAAYLSWLSENAPYLYFTGESFQLSSNPHPVNLDLGAKYLCKSVNADSGEIKNPLTEEECKCLECFLALDDNEKDVLSKFSSRINKRNKKLWNKWIHRPINEQASIAKEGLGGVRWL